MRDDLAQLLSQREGHFEFESGHHGDRWLELEGLACHPEALAPLIRELAQAVAAHRPEVVCGPLVEGAFVALLVAVELGLPFTYAARHDSRGPGLFPVDYRLPDAQRSLVARRRVAIVNDVINAGSAVRGALADLEGIVCEVVALGSLLVLGPAAKEISRTAGAVLETLAAEDHPLWPPDACPLCQRGVPCEPHPGT